MPSLLKRKRNEWNHVAIFIFSVSPLETPAPSLFFLLHQQLWLFCSSRPKGPTVSTPRSRQSRRRRQGAAAALSTLVSAARPPPWWRRQEACPNETVTSNGNHLAMSSLFAGRSNTFVIVYGCPDAVLFQCSCCYSITLHYIARKNFPG